MPHDRAHETAWSDAVFYRRVLAVAALAVIAAVSYHLAVVFLLVAGAIVVAVSIHLVADPLQRRLGVGPKLAAGAAIFLLFALASASLYFFGVEIARQASLLADELPAAIDELRRSWANGPFGSILGDIEPDGADAGAVLRYGKDAIGGLLSAIALLVIAISCGVVFAIYPATYREGALLLLPPRVRPSVRAASLKCARGLKGWLVGQLIAMVIIGVLTSVGLMLVGLPSWLALGLIAGAAQFVPVVGPVLSAIPGLIVAASIDGPMLAKALAVYVGVQQLESNLVTPLVMRKAAALPMALTLLSISAFTALFGLAGAIVATPMSVILLISARELYIKDGAAERCEGRRSGP